VELFLIFNRNSSSGGKFSFLDLVGIMKLVKSSLSDTMVSKFSILHCQVWLRVSEWPVLAPL
jgi:hypothetical protein